MATNGNNKQFTEQFQTPNEALKWLLRKEREQAKQLDQINARLWQILSAVVVQLLGAIGFGLSLIL